MKNRVLVVTPACVAEHRADYEILLGSLYFAKEHYENVDLLEFSNGGNLPTAFHDINRLRCDRNILNCSLKDLLRCLKSGPIFSIFFIGGIRPICIKNSYAEIIIHYDYVIPTSFNLEAPVWMISHNFEPKYWSFVARADRNIWTKIKSWIISVLCRQWSIGASNQRHSFCSNSDMHDFYGCAGNGCGQIESSGTVQFLLKGHQIKSKDLRVRRAANPKSPIIFANWHNPRNRQSVRRYIKEFNLQKKDITLIGFCADQLAGDLGCHYGDLEIINEKSPVLVVNYFHTGVQTKILWLLKKGRKVVTQGINLHPYIPEYKCMPDEFYEVSL